MKFRFSNKRITGILTILPSNEVRFEDEMDNYNFPAAKSLKLKMTMGYDKHRLVNPGICSSDLCIHGLKYLFEKELLRKEDIDALILVTQSPDFFTPPTSNIIQGHFSLKQDMICLDINQGCAGYIIGLIEAFLLLEQESVQKVVLLNADVLSRKVSKKDRNSNPLIGDGASVTSIENSSKNDIIYSNLKMDGKRADAIMIPAGGFRLPSTTQTSELNEDFNGNLRAKDHLVMKGDEVFNFVQTEVPPIINELLTTAGLSTGNVDYFLFHQPNKFMLQKLAEKLGVSQEKMPNNVVENFGNASGVSIPTAICYNLGSKLLMQTYLACLSGFGVGLTWGSLLMNIGTMEFCEIIEF
jgi:3-oxoacyl-[acyl-carrier-protein] synthase III